MNFEWSTNDIATMTLTIYETNLTLNKAACTHFEDVNYVLLGVDKSARQIGIKPVSKQEIDESDLSRKVNFIGFLLVKVMGEFPINRLFMTSVRNLD